MTKLANSENSDGHWYPDPIHSKWFPHATMLLGASSDRYTSVISLASEVGASVQLVDLVGEFRLGMQVTVVRDGATVGGGSVSSSSPRPTFDIWGSQLEYFCEQFRDRNIYRDLLRLVLRVQEETVIANIPD